VIDIPQNNTVRNLAILLIGLLALRLIWLFIAPWGLIGAATSIFGHAEWAVRLSAPLLHIATTLIIFLTGRRFWDKCTGFWAALTYVLMPAVWLSSFIMSTDAALLLCWAVA